MIYLDYAASSPADKEVLDVYYNATLKYISNPNSVHKLGLEAKNAVDIATSNIAKMLNIKPNEIIYTSGSSESNNLAIKGLLSRYKNKGKHIITTEVEHSSVTGPMSIIAEENCYEIEYVNINKNGTIDLEDLKNILREDTILVSIPYVDSEIGIKQPINEIGEILKNYPNTFFFTDATQAAGKIKLDLSNVDLASISPHKFSGLSGIGILYKKENIYLTPLIHGGKSTTVYRSGTPETALILSTEKALEISLNELDLNYEYVNKLNKMVREELSKLPLVYFNSSDYSIPYTLNLSVKGVKATDFAKELEEYEIYVSTKTACCPVNTASRSVYAITKDKSRSMATLRISFSKLTTENEIMEFIKYFKIIYDKIN